MMNNDALLSSSLYCSGYCSVPQVSSIIHNLKNMAMDMNAELGSQNEQIDRITLKVSKYFFKFF
jgi:hypothetical protein